MAMKKNEKEMVREYPHLLKNKMIYVQPSLLEKEIVTMFANTFKSPYTSMYLMSSST